MNFLKARLSAAGLFFGCAVLATMFTQFLLNRFSTGHFAPDSLFSLCYALGSLFAGYTIYYKLITQDIRLSKQDYQLYAIRKGAFAALWSYALGIICTVVFSMVTFFSHKTAVSVASQYGVFSTMTHIVGVTLQKTTMGFIQVALKQFAIIPMMCGGALAGFACAKLRKPAAPAMAASSAAA